MMTYEEAMDFLKNLTKFGYNFGLDRITRLLHMLGNPHHNLKVIHIGGTNGKGSTSAMISSILQSAGYRVGMFTSPHLHSYTERIQINKQEIPKKRIAELLTKMRPLLGAMVREGFEHPTEFEVNTAMALLYFCEEQVDFVILEVGLGGAIDSTNVVNPLVAVITNVSMDHMDYLGDTPEKIASVKAGIIKQGCRVVTAEVQPQVLRVIEEVCQEKKAELIKVGQDVRPQLLTSSIEGVSFKLKGLRKLYADLKIPLIGEHQINNASVAVAAVEALEYDGYLITEEAIRKGLEAVSWPARLEILRKNPVVLVDAAHNVAGAETLYRALTKVFHYRRMVLVIGMLADKERKKVLRILGPLAGAVIVTRPNSPRAGVWKDLAGFARQYVAHVSVIDSIEEAVLQGLSLVEKDDLLCITGSIYMIAEARKMLKSN